MKTERIGPLESALYCSTFVFGQLLISLSVLVSRLNGKSAGIFILMSLVITLVFQLVQKKMITQSFVSRFEKRFKGIDSIGAGRNILVMVLPPLTLAVGLLVTLILIR